MAKVCNRCEAPLEFIRTPAGKEIGRALLRQIDGLLAKGDLAVIP